uniref:DNA gyrase subunit A (EC) n=1 Tax=Ganoderma boninense TaxID=34458 RepID=A0A5K1JY84_9APHY|nr:DNA gyrase subunit A (EC [Ganoderma boninense]
MRLIDTHTGKFVEFVDTDKVPRYAILSHTWDPDGEQTYQEVLEIQGEYGLLPVRKHQKPPGKESEPSRADSDALGAVPHVSTPVLDVRITPGSRKSSLYPAMSTIWDSKSRLSEKVRRACEVARRDGYCYIWIDSCCIDKESSAELSEAINSMYNWYRGAQVCYGFLADVSPNEDVRKQDSEFRNSRWFKRGWTLQELVAPLVLVFLSQDWDYLGTKDGLAVLVKEITSIDVEILTHERALSEESVANRMQWAARRETTRVEDQAYSLLGIFGITMPTLYGEGENAFRRLQEQILERIPDHSIFVWGHQDAEPFALTARANHFQVQCTDTKTLLAPSPGHFGGAHTKPDYRQIVQPTEDAIRSLGLPMEGYTRTPYGIRTQLCLLPLEAFSSAIYIQTTDNDDTMRWYLLVLRSQYADERQQLLCRMCYIRTEKAQVELLYLTNFWSRSTSTHYSDICTLSIDDISQIRQTHQLETKTVYLPHPKPAGAKRHVPEGIRNSDTLSLNLPTWVLVVLWQEGGCTVANIQAPTQTERLPNHSSQKWLTTLRALTLRLRSQHTRTPARAPDPSPSETAGVALLSAPVDFSESNTNSFAFTLINVAFRIHIHYRCFIARHNASVVIAARVWILSPGQEALDTDTNIQSSPPYTAATWIDHPPWNMTLPSRRLGLVIEPWVFVTLSLGLDLIAPLQYNIRVGVGSYTDTKLAAPFRPSPHLEPKEPPSPFQTGLIDTRAPLNLVLVLTGSARRYLKRKRYSAHLALDQSLHSSYGSHSLTLTPANPTGPNKFVIVVKYLHAWQNSRGYFVLVARVTLESSFETRVIDGPCFVLLSDDMHQKWSLEKKSVVLDTPRGTLLTLRLGLDLAWNSEYYLNIDIEPDTAIPGPREMWPTQYDNLGNDVGLLNWAHNGIGLMLHGDDRYALQAQGYQVHFDAVPKGEESDNGVYHRLTLSRVNIVTITVEYSHSLTTDYHEPDKDVSKYPFFLAGAQMDLHSDQPTSTVEAPVPFKRCTQELTFRAAVQTEPPCSVQDVTPSRYKAQDSSTTAIVEWDAKPIFNRDSWSRNLEPKQITITLPTGHQLMLRLNLSFGWFSEYCVRVKIDPVQPLISPLSPPSQTDPDELPIPACEPDVGGVEDISQPGLTQGTEDGQSAEAHDDHPPADLRTHINPPGSLVGRRAGAGCGKVRDLDSHVDDEPLPVGPSTIEGSHGWSTEPGIVTNDKPLLADLRARITPEEDWLVGNQEDAGGEGGNNSDLHSDDKPFLAGPSNLESSQVRSGKPESMVDSVLGNQSPIGMEVATQGDAMHSATTRNGADECRAGVRRYGEKLRQMGRGARGIIQRGIQFLKS